MKEVLRGALICLLFYACAVSSLICRSPDKKDYSSYEPVHRVGVYSKGSVVTYKCDRGYVLHGSSKRTCLGSFHWSGQAPRCIPGCYKPKDPEYGSILSATKLIYSYGQYITYSCYNGYRLHGDAIVYCRRGYGWSHVPTCQGIRQANKCPHRRAPEYGYYTQHADKTNWYSGDVAYYGCQLNYILRGYQTSRCLDNGRWQYDVPICDPICRRPSQPNHGYIRSDPPHKERYQVKDYITYHCDHGYKLDGDEKVYCTHKGWSHSPTCRRYCPYRQAPEYGYYSNDQKDKKYWYPGEYAHYGCQPNYILHGYSSSKCQDDYTWQYEVPKCKRGCRRPSNPRYGSVHSNPSDKDKYEIDDYVTYSCDDGYRLAGDEKVYCRHNGWSHTPICKRYCPYRQAPEYGYYSNEQKDKKYWYPGEYAHYGCQPNYILHGYFSSKCQDDYTWQYDLPTCKRGCRRPSNPQYGSVYSNPSDKDKYEIDDYVTYRCDDGYKLDGDEKVYCRHNGWSHTPACKRYCPYRQAPEYGYYSNEQKDKKYWYPGEYAHYGCQPNYILHGYSGSKCQDDYTWQYEVPRCKRGCHRPSNPQYGSVHSNPSDKAKYEIDEYVTYKCDDGYKLDGDEKVYCRLNGWSHTPACKRYCPFRQAPEYGYYSNEQKDKKYWYPGEYGHYGCQPNYILHGYSSSKCQDDYSWQYDVPKCKLGCRRPSDPRYGSISSNPPHKDKYEIGDYVTYQCDNGYQLYGDSKVYCQRGGWSDSPSCKRYCPYREPPHNGYYHENNDKRYWYPGDIAQYRCNAGYILSGYSSSKCQDDYSWQYDVPRCQRRRILSTDPFTPTQEERTSSKLGIGSSIPAIADITSTEMRKFTAQTEGGLTHHLAEDILELQDIDDHEGYGDR
ncbi:unnamed protein product [Clavelina lepadiformis]|uniref:Sushi domain-containing protein n=1 Tax=Clavelina lepadiformis TaxID=159417 RepID=A0ABP0GG24_CLALP